MATERDFHRVEEGPSWIKNLSATYSKGKPVGDIPFKIDHWYYAESRTPYESDEPIFVFEPYDMSSGNIGELMRFCEDRGLDFHIEGRAEHHVDCFRVVIWKPLPPSRKEDPVAKFMKK
jgi:hypothetical protein